MATLKALHPVPSVSIESAEGYELLCPEAGRTGEGLTGTVVLKNGSFASDGRRLCFAEPADVRAARADLAKQTKLKPATFTKALRDLYELVEIKVRAAEQQRRDRAPQNGQAAGPRPLTDLGNAERLIDRHGKDLLYCYQWSEWLAFDGRRWQRDQAGAVARMARDTVRGIYEEAAAREHADERIELSEWARKSESRKHIEAMIALAESFVPVAPDQLDADPWLLNCANGTIDLRTGELCEHRREDLLTKWTPVVYVKDAQCLLFTRFVGEIMGGDGELAAFLHRALGYSLTGDCREQCLFVLYGKGSNGKSLLLKIVQVALGDYALQAVSDLLLAKRFDSHPTERADLFGKRFVATIEVEEGRRLAESLTKQLTGEDRIRARRMRQDFWEFEPTHKIFLAANHKPPIQGTDTGIWRRIHLVPFDVRFVVPGQESPDDPPDAKVGDPDLGNKLRGELPGILAWLVRGCTAWQAEGLKPPKIVKEATERYRAEMNVLAAWIGDCCFVGERACATAKDLYASYVTWCEENGEQAESQRAFAQRLTERGFVDYRTKKARMWKGIGLLVPPDDPARSGSGGDAQEEGQGDSSTTGDARVTHGDACPQTTSQNTPTGALTEKSRHLRHHASPDGPPATGVTRGDASDASSDISAHRGLFSEVVSKDASPCVTNVSRDPKTPYPTEPCPKGHRDEWEFARSSGEPAWYGYVCRHPECLPGDRYGCWLPAEACTEVRA